MEKEPTQEVIKPKNELEVPFCKPAALMLAEYAIKGGKDMEYVEYLRGNRPDPRD